MSYTRTETLIVIEPEKAQKAEKSKLSLRGLFGLKTKTDPGSPWPNPPSKTVTQDEDKGHCCCLPFRKK